MIIKLLINGEEKTFKVNFISGKKLRDTMAMSEEMEGKLQTATVLDEMVDYLVALFDKQFTRDEFYNGIESDKMMDTFTECVRGVVGKVENKSKLLEVSQGKK